jgi:hypothetical protein
MSKTIIDPADGATMHFKSNHQWRELFMLDALPEKDQADFTYIEGEDRYSTRLFKYRGSWYDTAEFTIAPDRIKALGFDGVSTESYFSAVIVCYFDKDGHYHDDEIIVGYIHW